MDDYFGREFERIQKALDAAARLEKMMGLADPVGDAQRKLGIHSPSLFESSAENMIRLARGIQSDSAAERLIANDPHLLKIIEDARQQTEMYDRMYRTPGVSDKLWMAAEIEQNLRKYAGLSLGLTQAELEIRSFQPRYPWLSTTDSAASVRAFVEFQSMAAAINALPPFSDDLATTLRAVLGDWRDPIKVPDGYFLDPSARVDFYIQRGYNPAVADVPPAAFNERIELGEFLDDDDPLDFEGAPDLASVKRTNNAQYRLLCFEIQLKRFIEREMLRIVGPQWIKHRVPGPIREQWANKQADQRAKGETELPPLDNADFGHYVDIICRTDNWEGVFIQRFRRKEFVMEFFNQVTPVRNAVDHGRLIVQDDWVYLCVALKRLRKLIS